MRKVVEKLIGITKTGQRIIVPEAIQMLKDANYQNIPTGVGLGQMLSKCPEYFKKLDEHLTVMDGCYTRKYRVFLRVGKNYLPPRY